MPEKYFHIKKVPKVLTLKWIVKQLNKLQDFLRLNDQQINDHRDVYKPLYNNKYYNDKIFNTYNIDDFIPEIVFCEDNIELNDLWMVYRLKISSCKFSKQPGMNVKILLRDNLTQKYIGIMSLSSDIFNLICRDKFIGWSYQNKLDGKLQNIMNITTCVAIPPLSFNFNIGKLLTMIAFSKEIHRYIKKKYNKKIAGIVTLSLYGKSIQYDRLKELKLIGYTKGYGTIQIPDIIYELLLKYCHEQNIEIKKKKNKLYSITTIFNKLNLHCGLLNHNIERGIYFGYVGTGAKEFLCGKQNSFKKENIKPLKEIFSFWKERWAIHRFENLLATNRVMINYESKNILTDQDIINKKVKKHRNKTKVINKNEINNDELIEIIKYKYYNKDVTCNKISSIFSEKFNKKIDHKKIKRLLLL